MPLSPPLSLSNLSSLLHPQSSALVGDDHGFSCLRLPASSNPEVFEVQRTLVEAWEIATDSFFDENMNRLDWPAELRTHMLNAYSSSDPKAANGEIDSLLSSLGDPYTRHIPAEAYSKFKDSTDGEIQGVGLLIATQMSREGLLVLAPIKGGPADRAGVLPGDEVTAIDGKPVVGMSGEQAVELLKGRGGTEVRVKLTRRTTDVIPGVPQLPPPSSPSSSPSSSSNEVVRVKGSGLGVGAGVVDGPASIKGALRVLAKEVRLRREKVSLSPVFYTSLDPITLEPAAANINKGERSAVGYLRLNQFSSNASYEMNKAIRDLKSKGARSYILDLRSNPGGLVSASVEVASLWLDGNKTVFQVKGREGEAGLQTTQSSSPAITNDPLVVLVDESSASASEILSGALRDNKRAAIVGDSATFGKGRIQSVFELHDGSALFVTVAKYLTPNGTEIDQRGVKPDVSCLVPGSTAPSLVGGQGSFLAGIPSVGNAMESILVQQLKSDRCVLKAAQMLQKQSRQA